jgi:hypothetical protein
MPEYVPAMFKCRQHDLVLTDSVSTKVAASLEPVPSMGWQKGRRPSPRPFRVLVHCPGTDGEDDSHDLVFAGTVQP